jgi:cytoskeleton protein RodZ
METLGQFLKSKRETQGYSLQGFSIATRIHPSVLQKIEKDDYGTAPERIYLKAFLKSYAMQLDLNEKEVLTRFDEQGDEPLPPKKLFPLKPKEKSRPKSILIISFVVVLIGLAAFLLSR